MRKPRWLRWRSESEFDEEIQAHVDLEIREHAASLPSRPVTPRSSGSGTSRT